MSHAYTLTDRLCMCADTALRTLFVRTAPQKFPSLLPQDSVEMTVNERKHAAGLMRVNHVGEVCAQALYSAQSLMSESADKKKLLNEAAKEEEQHLAWTNQRLEELGARSSLLNPFWYAGSFGLGALVAKFGDEKSLGFIMETERQVEAHLAAHLSDTTIGLPAKDVRSRAIVAQMKEDEAAHASMAKANGGTELPKLVQSLMRSAAKLMTYTAYRI